MISAPCSPRSATTRSTRSSTPWCPRASGCAARSPCSPAWTNASVAARDCAHRRQEPGLPLVHRHGLLRHLHAAGDPAQHAREPGLVHGLHAVPGGDRPGPARGAAQLPDDGERPHRRCRSRTPRCSTKAPRPPRRWRSTLAVHRSTSGRRRFFVDAACHPQTIAVVRTRAEARGVAVRGRRSRQTSTFAADVVGCLLQYPGDRWQQSATTAAVAERAHAAGALVTVGDRPAGAHAAHAAGRVGRRHRRRQLAALRRAARLRRPARRVLRHASDEYKRHMPGRIIGVSKDARRQAGAAHGAADARAAHPPREGHQQHLHRAGAAGRDGEHVRGVSRARGLRRIAAADARPRGAPRARAAPRCGFALAHDAFFDTVAVEVEPCTAAADRSTRRARGRSTSARRRRPARASSLDETVTRGDVPDADRGLRAGTRRCRSAQRRAAPSSRDSRGAAAHAARI